MEEFETLTGRIYLGRVENIVPGLNGAFINIGESKNAFLRLRDLNKSYMSEVLRKEKLEKGDKVLVQVRKDSTRVKGPQVTTKLSLSGRYVIYFPLNHARGISRRITNGSERERLKRILKRLRRKGEGLIIRTAAEGVPEELIEEELDSLREEWRNLLNRFRRSRKVKVLLEEPSVEEKVVRERLDRSVDKLVTNDPEIADLVRREMGVYGRTVEIEYVDGDVFEKTGVYEMLEDVTKRTIFLDSGAFIVIDRTEAMTVIDVNSASFTDPENHRELVLRTNLEAVEEIARQIRLRNIGGVIVIDFITMEWEEDRRKVLEKLEEELRKDRARTEVLGFTKLGLLEMTRKRTSRSLDSFLLSPCPVCHGSGRIISPLIVFNRIVNEIGSVPDAKRVKLRVHPVLSGYFNTENKKRLKRKLKKDIDVQYDWCDPATFDVKFYSR